MKGFQTIAAMALIVGSSINAAHAAATTWTFIGVMSSGVADAGKTITGFLTLDPASLPLSSTGGWINDGVTTANGKAFYYPPYLTMVGGQASLGGISTISLGGGAVWDTAQVNVQKRVPYYNEGTFFDQFQVYGGSSNGDAIGLLTTAFTNGVNPSAIFSNATYADPFLNLDQTVNWFSSGSSNTGVIVTPTGGVEFFNLTSIVVASVPEPTTPLLMLAGLGLLLGFFPRRHANDARPDKAMPAGMRV